MTVLDKYFTHDTHFLTRHHLDSYNTFISKDIVNTIQSMNPFPIIKFNRQGDKKIKHKIEVFIGGEDGTSIEFTKPAMPPMKARLEDQTYLCELKANILVRSYYKDRQPIDKTIKDITLCKIPIMLHSDLCMIKQLGEMGECRFDQGGYFIVDGKEKVIVSQESVLTNRLFINSVKDDDKIKYQAFIRCTSEKDSVFPKTIWIYVLKDSTIVLKMPHIEKQIPIFMLFRALGAGSDRQILEEYIGVAADDHRAQEFLRPSILDCQLYDQAACLEFLSDFVEFKRVEHVKYAILNNLFPNTEASFCGVFLLAL